MWRGTRKVLLVQKESHGDTHFDRRCTQHRVLSSPFKASGWMRISSVVLPSPVFQPTLNPQKAIFKHEIILNETQTAWHDGVSGKRSGHLQEQMIGDLCWKGNIPEDSILGIQLWPSRQDSTFCLARYLAGVVQKSSQVERRQKLLLSDQNPIASRPRRSWKAVQTCHLSVNLLISLTHQRHKDRNPHHKR